MLNAELIHCDALWKDEDAIPKVEPVLVILLLKGSGDHPGKGKAVLDI